MTDRDHITLILDADDLWAESDDIYPTVVLEAIDAVRQSIRGRKPRPINLENGYVDRDSDPFFKQLEDQ